MHSRTTLLFRLLFGFIALEVGKDKKNKVFKLLQQYIDNKISKGEMQKRLRIIATRDELAQALCGLSYIAKCIIEDDALLEAYANKTVTVEQIRMSMLRNKPL